MHKHAKTQKLGGPDTHKCLRREEELPHANVFFPIPLSLSDLNSMACFWTVGRCGGILRCEAGTQTARGHTAAERHNPLSYLITLYAVENHWGQKWKRVRERERALDFSQTKETSVIKHRPWANASISHPDLITEHFPYACFFEEASSVHFSGSKQVKGNEGKERNRDQWSDQLWPMANSSICIFSFSASV